MKFPQTFLQKIKQDGMLSAILGLLLLTAFLSPIVSSDGYAFSNTLVEKKTLVAKANQDGSIRIIVRVKTTQPFQPMADTVSSSARAQMNQIDSAQESVLRGLAGHKILNSYKFRYTPYLSMTVDSAALDSLLASPDVQQIQEDTLNAPTLDKSVPRIGASNLHSSNIKGTGITIAVLDTGVDKTHPFLSRSVVSEACYSTNYLPYSSTTICPGGVTESTAVDSAMPYISGICPAEECDHGTHVAGIAGGRQSVSGSPGPGVAPEADIIAVQVFSRFDSDAYCGGTSPCALSYTSDQLKGLERVYELRDTYTIASVNMSLGGGKYSSVSECDRDSRKEIIDNLRAAGIATIIASGNDGYCGYINAPACISSAISVGATTDTDSVASYSNSADFMSLFAPGSTINSSIPGSSYASWNGTSMATPHVAGAWALLKQQRPDASVTEILSAFQATGLSVTDGDCSSVTKKRINVLENFMTAPAYNLNVNSSHASSVAITGNPGLYSGTTNYSESTIDPDTNITLAAPSTSGSVTFINWSGCDSTASTDCTVSMTKNKTVTANYTSADAIALQHDVTVSNLSGAQDEMLDYYITVPTGTHSLTVQIWGGNGDADLYVRYGSKPTLTDWDYRPYLTGNKENVFISNPKAGNWYISANGYSAFSGVNLKAKFGSPWSLFMPAILSKPQ